jgi:mRNA-degrading endonuclease RelE of RelBE toxin-antitoxin system
MSSRVIVGQRVKDFLQTLASEPRRKLWRALKGLAQGKGDLKQLEGNLHPFWRLRVDRMRVIYEPRSVVTAAFNMLLRRPSIHRLCRA